MGSKGRKILLLLTLLLLVSIGCHVLPVSCAETTTFETSASDGYLYYQGTNYSGVWSGDDYDVRGKHPSETFGSAIGQWWSGTQFHMWRSYIYFDTSTLPVNVKIEAVVLSFYITIEESVTDFNIVIQSGMPTYPHEPFDWEDWTPTHYSGNGGQVSTEGMQVNQWYNITFSEQGKGWINVGGQTKFCLRSSRDIAQTEPTDKEYVCFGTVEGGNPAKLIVTYEIPPSPSSYAINAAQVLAVMFGLFAVVLGFMVVKRPKEMSIKEVVAYLIVICVLCFFATIFANWGY